MSLTAIIDIGVKHYLYHKTMYEHMMNMCCDMQMEHNDAKWRIRTRGVPLPWGSWKTDSIKRDLQEHHCIQITPM